MDLQIFAGTRGQDIAYLKVGANKLTNDKRDLTVTWTNAEIDTADASSAGYAEAIMGDQNVTISGSFNYQLEASAAAAQLAIIDAGADQSDLTLEWAIEELAGARKWTGTGFVTSCAPVNGDPSTISFTIRIKSKPTQGTQS